MVQRPELELSYSSDQDDNVGIRSAPPKRGDSQVAPHKREVVLFLKIQRFPLQVWMNKKRPDLGGLDVPIVLTNPDNVVIEVNDSAERKGYKSGDRLGNIGNDIRKQHPDLNIIEMDTNEGLLDYLFELMESDRILDQIFRYRRTLKNTELIKIQRDPQALDEFYISVTDLVYSRMNSKFRKEESGGKLVQGLALPSDREMKNLIKMVKGYSPGERGLPLVNMEGLKGPVNGEDLLDCVRNHFHTSKERFHTAEAMLVHAAVIAEKMIYQIRKRTGYQVAAGVGHNKLIAKLALKTNPESKKSFEGITIFPEISYDRLSRQIKLQDLPYYGFEIGGMLLEKLGKDGTLKTIQDWGLERLVDVFMEMKQRAPLSAALDLLNKAKGLDSEVVMNKTWHNSISQKMSLKGRNIAHSWKEFEDRVRSFSVVFVEKILYHYKKHHRRVPGLTVRLPNKPGLVRIDRIPGSNYKPLTHVPTEEEMFNFIMGYVEQNLIDFHNVASLEMTGAPFVPTRGRVYYSNRTI